MDTNDDRDVAFSPAETEVDYMILRRRRQRVLIFPDALKEEYFLRGVLETDDPFMKIPIKNGALNLVAGTALLIGACLF